MSVEDDLPELREIGNGYARLARVEQPPAELDRAIRDAAAAHAARARARRARARTWGIGAAIAATLVVAVAAVLRTDGDAAPNARSAAASAEQARAAAPFADDDAAGASAKITFDSAPDENVTGDECAGATATPDPWLACIATLARAGRASAAARELDAFRARFPAHEPLPDLDALAPR